MTDDVSNDNDVDQRAALPRTPDAHGQAALLLIESLVHGLIERSVIDVNDAVEILGTAVAVAHDITEDAGAIGSPPPNSLTLLGAMSASLELDLPHD